MSDSLFNRLGGEGAVDAAGDIFYRKVLADDSVSRFFDDTDMDAQRGKQKSFLTMAFGGPNNYTGTDMREANKHLVEDGLNEDHFNAVAGHLQGTPPLTWAQRLKRVFERAALGLILPCAPYVAVPCGLSLTSLIQTSSKRFSITSKHNHHRLSLRLPFNPTACKPADQHHYSH